MEWTLAILFFAAAILLITSLVNAKKTSISEQREIDVIHLSVMEELEGLQKQVRNLELDMEILEKEAGVKTNGTDRIVLREVIDLYRRKYSFESIAAQKQLTQAEVEEMLAPYLVVKEERRKVLQ
ncbi:hypothetical protein [Bacillus sp. B1-b2]|uniref:hypothetical protein n=1 Tax=Bacillus sp. B1-b2 TaxID=2653201 RepID=UPI0012622B45|nr:hypothetical protein [Bacillus sp. B1-b2]KAB7671235.1 hypothetical protein F9279_06905 [Bacillus sp. B1-b2]